MIDSCFHRRYLPKVLVPHQGRGSSHAARRASFRGGITTRLTSAAIYLPFGPHHHPPAPLTGSGPKSGAAPASSRLASLIPRPGSPGFHCPRLDGASPGAPFGIAMLTRLSRCCPTRCKGPVCPEQGNRSPCKGGIAGAAPTPGKQGPEKPSVALRVKWKTLRPSTGTGLLHRNTEAVHRQAPISSSLIHSY